MTTKKLATRIWCLVMAICLISLTSITDTFASSLIVTEAAVSTSALTVIEANNSSEQSPTSTTPVNDLTLTVSLGNCSKATSSAEIGDVNHDGTIDAKDAAEVLEYSAKVGASEESTVCPNGDVDSDGIADATDAAKLLVYAAILGLGGYADWPPTSPEQSTSPAETTSTTTETTTTATTTTTETTTTPTESITTFEKGQYFQYIGVEDYPLRDYPDEDDSEIIAYLNPGDIVQIELTSPERKGWAVVGVCYQDISSSEQFNWVTSLESEGGWLKIEASLFIPVGTDTCQYQAGDTFGLISPSFNIRSMPTKNSQSLAYIYTNAGVTIVYPVANDWYCVTYFCTETQMICKGFCRVTPEHFARSHG